jgi:hypothetical protein
MAENDWTLVEFRPGRYVKVSAGGEVLGKATEAEARAWFARRGWPLDEAVRQIQRIPPTSPRPRQREPEDLLPSADGQPHEMPAQLASDVEMEADVVEAEPPTPTAQEATPPHKADVAVKAPDTAVTDGLLREYGPPAAAAGVDEDVELEEPVGPTGTPEGEAEDRWLWVDPGEALGQKAGVQEIGAFLRGAAGLFRAKDWTGGSTPGRVAVHPDLVTEALEAAAVQLHLEVVSDPRVMRGTYMFGLAESEKR